MKVHIKYIYYYKFETKIIADNEQKLSKIGRAKVHSHDGQWRGIVMFTPTLRCECAQPGLIDTMRKWSIHLLRALQAFGKHFIARIFL